MLANLLDPGCALAARCNCPGKLPSFGCLALREQQPCPDQNAAGKQAALLTKLDIRDIVDAHNAGGCTACAWQGKGQAGRQQLSTRLQGFAACRLLGWNVRQACKAACLHSRYATWVCKGRQGAPQFTPDQPLRTSAVLLQHFSHMGLLGRPKLLLAGAANANVQGDADRRSRRRRRRWGGRRGAGGRRRRQLGKFVHIEHTEHPFKIVVPGSPWPHSSQVAHQQALALQMRTRQCRNGRKVSCCQHSENTLRQTWRQA